MVLAFVSLRRYNTRGIVSVSTELRVDRAWVEVDLANLVENARAVRHAAHDAPLLPMVKADGYGLGAVQVVRALETIEPWGFGVATVSEGVELRRAGVTRPIVVFTPARIDDLSRLGENELTAVLDDPAVIDECGTDQPYHCEVDTGMGRAGIRWNDAAGLRALARNPPQGVFTHLHSADTSEDAVNVQLGRFREVVSSLAERPRFVHVANSAGAWRVDEHFDLVRPGIFLYGGQVGQDLPEPKPVASLRAYVVSVRRLDSGDTVSYGAEWTAAEPTTVGTLSIGYADGVPRAVQGRASVIVAGRRRPIVGRVTMDMTVVDLGPDDPGGVGDVATLIGTDGDERIALDEFASWAGTISYEILVKLGDRLPRVYRGP